jgi:Uma2 family endonuclease
MTELAFKTGEFTFKHYMTWPEQERWQLFNGVAHAMALPNWAHQSVVTELARQLGNALHDKPCQVRVAPVGVRLPKHNEADELVRTVFEPDILVVCDARKIDKQGVRGAPDVIIEVLSPSTAVYDQIDKRIAYSDAGVRELWLIDVANGLVTIYRQIDMLSGPQFGASEIVRATGELSLQALDGLTLDLNFIDALRLNVE